MSKGYHLTPRHVKLLGALHKKHYEFHEFYDSGLRGTPSVVDYADVSKVLGVNLGSVRSGLSVIRNEYEESVVRKEWSKIGGKISKNPASNIRTDFLTEHQTTILNAAFERDYVPDDIFKYGKVDIGKVAIQAGCLDSTVSVDFSHLRRGVYRNVINEYYQKWKNGDTTEVDDTPKRNFSEIRASELRTLNNVFSSDISPDKLYIPGGISEGQKKDMADGMGLTVGGFRTHLSRLRKDFKRTDIEDYHEKWKKGDVLVEPPENQSPRRKRNTEQKQINRLSSELKVFAHDAFGCGYAAIDFHYAKLDYERISERTETDIELIKKHHKAIKGVSLERLEKEYTAWQKERENMHHPPSGHRDSTETVKVDTLTKVILNNMGDRKLEEPEAKRLAEHVMNFFGYENRIIDNILEPEDRDMFYMMEDSGILTTGREETTLHDGREWRIHYWTFHANRVRSLIDKVEEEEENKPEPTVYDKIFSNDETFFEEYGRDGTFGMTKEEQAEAAGGSSSVA